MSLQHSQEEDRLKSVYKERDSTGRGTLYSWHNPDVIYTSYRYNHVTSRMLVKAGISDLSSLEILDVGCGRGSFLRLLVDWGASPSSLHGIDLLYDRIEAARILAPSIDVRAASALRIPFGEGSMDLVSANTVLSSVLDDRIRKTIASEIARVTRRAGAIFLYDFVISHPLNPNTRKLTFKDVKDLFPEFDFRRMRLTLAPPIQRELTKLEPVLAHAFEVAFPFLRTHAAYLGIRREPDND